MSRTLRASDSTKLAAYAHACAKENDYFAAEGAAQLATIADPQCFEAWVMLGICYAKGNKFARAVPCYVKALELRPNDIACWSDLGELFVSLMDYPKAAATFRKVMELDPNAAHPSGRRARAVVGRTLALLKKQV